MELTPEQKLDVRSELNRILRSRLFQSSKRCHDFLEAIVTLTLDGKTDSLSERFLGADLFGRPLDYDTKADAIVRVRANDVRKRLAEYYQEHTEPQPVTISLGTGSYIPEFLWSAEKNLSPGHHTLQAARPARPLQETEDRNASFVLEIPRGSFIPVIQRSRAIGDEEPPTSEDSSEGSLNGLERRQSRRYIRFSLSRRLCTAVSMVAGVLILALSIGCISLWQELRNTRRMLYPWKASPVVAEFWSDFLADQQDTDIVLADASISLIQAITGRSFGLSDYISRAYMNQLQDQDPRVSSNLLKISNWNLASPSEFEVAQRILTLDPAHQKIHIYSARKYMPDLIARHNVILFGSKFANPWTELFENRMNFILDPQNPNKILNRSPAKGEPPVYEYATTGSLGYCIVAYLPTPNHDGSALLIQGTSGEATQAAGDFLLTETKMADFKKMIAASKLPYFELLLKTSIVKGTPISSSIVAYRTYGASN
ncbi:MAG: hypothetical protein P4L03_02975 [Terracidiphilus sp.]|nr:hypothetical protein [Terracidiphilus sp.]